MGDLERPHGVLLHQEDRRAGRVDLQDGLEDRVDEDRREPERWLVEHEELRAAHHRPADGEHLLLSSGQRARELRLALLEAREEREDALHVVSDGGLVLPGVRAHAQVVDDLHAREEPAALGRLANAEPDDAVRRRLGDVLAAEGDTALRGVHESRDRAERRGLAGTVAPDEGHDLALVAGDAHAVERLDPTVKSIDPRELQEGHQPRTRTRISAASRDRPR